MKKIYIILKIRKKLKIFSHNFKFVLSHFRNCMREWNHQMTREFILDFSPLHKTKQQSEKAMLLFSPSVVSDSLWPHEPARLLCPRDSSGKNTGEGCHFLLHGDLPDPRIKPMSLLSPALAGRFFNTSATWEAMQISPETNTILMSVIFHINKY